MILSIAMRYASSWSQIPRFREKVAHALVHEITSGSCDPAPNIWKFTGPPRPGHRRSVQGVSHQIYLAVDYVPTNGAGDVSLENRRSGDFGSAALKSLGNVVQISTMSGLQLSGPRLFGQQVGFGVVGFQRIAHIHELHFSLGPFGNAKR